MRARYAFTLIELLIVVAIIGILAAIALPNFLCARIKAKVARVHSDRRAIFTAVESFRIDNGKYPVRIWSIPNVCVDRTDLACACFADMRDGEPVYLDTPIAYVSTYPSDPFRSAKFTEDSSPIPDPASRGLRQDGYQFGSNGTGYYIITSYGPDVADGAGGREELHEQFYTGAISTRREAAFMSARHTLEQLTYALSNGCQSRGDVFRLGP